MKKTFVFLLLILLAIVLAACSEVGETPTSDSDSEDIASDVYANEPIEDEYENATSLEGPYLEDFELDVEEETALYSALIQSGRAPQNPTEIMRTLIDADNIVFYHVPNIIYSTSASENGLGDTHMFVQGVVESFEIFDSFHAVFVQTDDGMLALLSSRGINDTGQEVHTRDAEWELLQVGQEFGIFFLYLGFSDEIGLAAGIFMNIEMDELTSG